MASITVELESSTGQVSTFEATSIVHDNNTFQISAIEQPDLTSLLTIVVTSSPARCNPSLEMLEIVVDSFRAVPGLAQCRTIVMCDGYKRGAKHRPSKGVVDEKSAADYEGFLENLHRASSDVESSCALSGVEVVVQPERMGFGFAVKRAVEDFVTTPYIMVVHHDQRYRRSFPLASVVAEMEKSQGQAVGQINYVGVLSPGTLGYEEKCKTTKGMPDPSPNVLTCGGNTGRLVPLFMWFDRNHIASVQYYKENVFTSGYVKKGSFIEGKVMFLWLCRHGIHFFYFYTSMII